MAPMTSTFASASPTALDRRQPVDNDIRVRALERLYARRNAVDALIQSLEDYMEIRQANRAKCIPLMVSRKCS